MSDELDVDPEETRRSAGQSAVSDELDVDREEAAPQRRSPGGLP